ncbi:unnamed protein product [Amoebophrya sp. A25]|nr:unnamed protein product [Amoebophrya sp. A25]|eukprot:GSA25T00010112001.1
MPRSKRNKVIALTKVKKGDNKERKDGLIERIQDAVEKYQHVMLLRVENQKNELVKQVRQKFKSNGLVFMGNNNVMRLALGTDSDSEIADKIAHLGEKIGGECALLCTDASPAEAQRYFLELQEATFAKSGAAASETFTIPKGELNLPFSMEQHLRSCGLPTQLRDGKIIMLADHTVCHEGRALTVDQAQVLKLLGRKTSIFRMTPTGLWSKTETGGSYKNLGNNCI